ncbi:MAG TPA: hypothetical protein HA362_02555 [Nanoarchaeota archaeon]|nr:hypothetical protein [Nanoarchaeota archaeon]
MNISPYLLPSASVVIFAVGIILLSMAERKTYYTRLITACLALVLVPVTFILNEYLAYALQALVLLAIANISREYYKAGFFRRRKELMELFRHDHPEHRDAKNLLYRPLRDIETKEQMIEKKLAEIENIEQKLKDKEEQLKEERRRIDEDRDAVKDAHREAIEKEGMP